MSIHKINSFPTPPPTHTPTTSTIFLSVFWFSSPSRKFIYLEKQMTCRQLIGDIKHMWKTIVFFHARRYGFSQGRSRKSLYIIEVNTMNKKPLLKRVISPYHIAERIAMTSEMLLSPPFCFSFPECSRFCSCYKLNSHPFWLGVECRTSNEGTVPRDIPLATRYL